MTSNPEHPSAPGTGEVLAPSIGVPVGLVILGGACLGLWPVWNGAPWLAGTVAVFGLFLLLQTALLRLEFTDNSLLVWRQNTLLRCFPYSEWLAWRLFWPNLPALFYFREQRSIHLLPVLFNPATLRQQLNHHLGHLAPDAAPNG